LYTAVIKSLKSEWEKIKKKGTEKLTPRQKNIWGKRFENFAELLLSCVHELIPRGRGVWAISTKTRHKVHDYDLIFLNKSFLRKELGNYILVECKFHKGKVGYPDLAKLFHKLHTKRCSTGIVFTMEGIKDETTIREIYDNDNIIIIIINSTDIETILSEIENLASLLRKKYEQIKFRLP
jgi:predicted helicase